MSEQAVFARSALGGDRRAKWMSNEGKKVECHAGFFYSFIL